MKKQNVTHLLALVFAITMIFSCQLALAEQAGTMEYGSAEEILSRDFSKHIGISFAGVQVVEGLDYTTGNDYYKHFSNLFNISYDVQGLQYRDWARSLSTWINSEDLPDWSVWNFNAGDAANYAEQELVKKLPDDWRVKYPNLAKVADLCEANAYYEEKLGGMYYLFRPQYGTGYPAKNLSSSISLYIRTDYAMQAGYDLSKNLESGKITISEFMDYCRAVKAAGICEYPWWNYTGRVGVFLGLCASHSGVAAGYTANAYYRGEDGQYHWGPGEEDSGIKAALGMMKQAYDEGLLYSDFYALATDEDAEHFYGKGDCAALVAEGDAAYFDRYAQQMQELLGVSFWDAATVLVLTDNEGICHGDPNVNFWACNILNPDMDDEKLDRILTLWDYSCTDEGQLEIRLGLKGIDWDFDESGNPVSFLTDTEFGNVENKYTATRPIYSSMVSQGADFNFINPAYSNEARDLMTRLYLTRSDCYSADGQSVDWELYSYSSNLLSAANFTYHDEFANLLTQAGDFSANYDAWVKDKMSLIQPVLDDMNAQLAQ